MEFDHEVATLKFKPVEFLEPVSPWVKEVCIGDPKATPQPGNSFLRLEVFIRI